MLSVLHQKLAIYKPHNRDLLVCFGLTVLKVYYDCHIFAYSRGIGLKPDSKRQQK